MFVLLKAIDVLSFFYHIIDLHPEKRIIDDSKDYNNCGAYFPSTPAILVLMIIKKENIKLQWQRHYAKCLEPMNYYLKLHLLWCY